MENAVIESDLITPESPGFVAIGRHRQCWSQLFAGEGLKLIRATTKVHDFYAVVEAAQHQLLVNNLGSGMLVVAERTFHRMWRLQINDVRVLSIEEMTPDKSNWLEYVTTIEAAIAGRAHDDLSEEKLEIYRILAGWRLAAGMTGITIDQARDVDFMLKMRTIERRF